MRLACVVLLCGATWASAAEKTVEQRVADLEKIVTANPIRRDDGLEGRVAALERAQADRKEPDRDLRRDVVRLEDRCKEIEQRLVLYERDGRAVGRESGDRDLAELRREMHTLSREVSNVSRDMQSLERRVSSVEGRR